MNTIAFTARHALSASLKGKMLTLLSYIQKQNVSIMVTDHVYKYIKNEPHLQDFPVLSIENITSADAFIFFGGDGTLLRSVYDFAPQIFSIPIFGINAGNLGFFSSLSFDEGLDDLGTILLGQGNHDKRMVLKGSILCSKGQEKYSFYALNESTIHHSGIARVRKMHTSVSGEFLTEYKADGLIIATPTGSTAYNMAAGGPIVAAQNQNIVITPLAPSGFSQRSIVLPAHKTISIIPDAAMRVSVDGKQYFSIKKDETLCIQRHDVPLSFLRLPKENYYKNLREKLGWG